MKLGKISGKVYLLEKHDGKKVKIQDAVIHTNSINNNKLIISSGKTNRFKRLTLNSLAYHAAPE
jgi:hypothetical protein